jgi:hypothetical protein
MADHDDQALQELPDLYRRALVLADAGIKNDAIAKELEVAVEAVKALLEIGRAKLANQRQRGEPSPDPRDEGSPTNQATRRERTNGRSGAVAPIPMTTDLREDEPLPAAPPSRITRSRANPEPAAQIGDVQRSEPIAWLTRQLAWENQLDRLRTR